MFEESILEVFFHRDRGMVWIGKHLKDQLIPIALPWAGIPITKPGHLPLGYW